MWCKLSEPVNDAKLLEAATRNGVVFVPGSVDGSDAGFVRFTFARAKTECIGQGIAGFARALHSLRN